ncbi:MAG: glycoside hydrolase family 3 N-terminal domain-containing protein [Candidatus Coproplasma sp.]
MMEFFKKVISKKKLWRTLSVILLTFAIIFTVVSEVAFAFESTLNYALKTSSFVTVNPDGYDPADYMYYSSDYGSSDAVTAYGKAVSREVESEGLVLMKNKDGFLPLSSGSNVSTVLQTAYNFSYGSSGSGAIDATKYTDLKTALEGVGLNVNSALWNFYAANPSQQAITYDRNSNPLYKVNALAWSDYTDEVKTSISSVGGTAIVVVGRLGGEGEDLSTKKSDGYDGSYLSLTKEEIEILAELTKLKNAGKINGIAVIINTALAMETAFLDDNWTVTIDDTSYTVDVDACMWVGNVGIGGIYAVADALVGKVNPSGRLTDTYVKNNFASPATASWVLQNKTGTFSTAYDDGSLGDSQKYYGVYVEGIYVGYRYFETRYEDYILGRADTGSYDYDSVVSRPFGYGLSYTSFEYSDYTVEKTAGGDYEVSVTVTNTGSLAGKESVQVYLQKPYTQYDIQTGVEKASVELAGFAKTATLAPGSSETVTVTVEKQSFKTYDAYGYETYILEEGDYYLATGFNAHDALNNILALKGAEVEGDSALAKKVGEDITLDYTTYSVSEYTGEDITNQLDFCDINEYSGKGSNSVEYVSRSNWAGTFPTQAIVLAVTEQMKADLVNGKDIEEEEDSAMPAYGEFNGLTLIMLRGKDYNDEDWDKLIDQMTWSDQAKLVTSAAYGTTGITSVTLPEVKAEDGPTGVVSSKDSVSFPSEGVWAATLNTELIEKVGDALAEDALNVGVTGLYVPGVNIHRSAFGGRAHEYFSEDPYLSAVSVESEIKGIQAKGVVPYVKHYVFNDQEDNRIGVGIWLNEQSAREIYLKPFEYAVAPTRGNAHCVMSSFNRAGCIWTSASEELMETILRGEFGFDGAVLTDMALGQNAYMTYDAFTCGTDLFLDPNGSGDALNAYSSSVTFRNAVREAVHRYLYVIANYSAAMNGYSPETKTVRSFNWWQTTLISVVVVFFVLAAVAVALTAASYLYEYRSADKKRRSND